MHEAADRFAKLLADTYVVRSRDEIARFFDGLDMVDHGLVQIDRWRPPAEPEVEAESVGPPPPPIYGAVARKP